MEYKLKNETKTDIKHSKLYETDQPLNIDILIEILKSFEDKKTKMFKCRCSTYTEEGRPWDVEYHSSEELYQMHNLPNPSIDFRAAYIDENDKYKFDISSDVNSRLIELSVDNKYGDIINKQVQLRRMKEDEKTDL